MPAERAFLQALRTQAARPHPTKAHPLRVGIGDDCAVLSCRSGWEWVVTTDLFLQNVHFRPDWHSPESAGHRCLARGLSDVAAMGALPAAAFLSLARTSSLSGDWTRRFLSGLLRLADSFGVILAGGDTAAAPKPSHGAPALFVADIVLLGQAPQGKSLLRSGARAGDLIYVTGSLGGAAAELASLRATAPKRQPRRPGASSAYPQLFPQPRVNAGALLRRWATAAIDVSDGLSTDLAHLCQESGLGATVELDRLPVHPLARQRTDALPLALHGGEDYELLFTAPAGCRVPRSLAGVPVTRIGRMVEQRQGRPQLLIQAPDGTAKPLGNKGWQHSFTPAQRRPVRHS